MNIFKNENIKIRITAIIMYDEYKNKKENKNGPTKAIKKGPAQHGKTTNRGARKAITLLEASFFPQQP